jgi:dihydrodipicolinate synthase/N-acetylneuraminate lyase
MTRTLALYAIAPTIFSSDGETVDAPAMAAAAQRMVAEGIHDFLQGTASLGWLAESVAAIRARSSGRVRVLAASDLTAVLGLLAGADGLTSTNSWAFPGAIRGIVAGAAGGDWESARQIAAALEPYFTVARRLGQPRTVKAAMRLRGLPGTDAVRVPYQPLDASEYNTLRAAMGECDDALTKLGVAPQQSVVSGQ